MAIGANWDYLPIHKHSYARPFFLYSLDKETILDIFWRKILIMVQVNLWKLIEPLQEIGLEARIPGEEEYTRVFLPVSKKYTVSSNHVAELHLGSLHYVSHLLFFEHLSIKGFTNYVNQMAEVLKEASIKDFNKSSWDT